MHLTDVEQEKYCHKSSINGKDQAVEQTILIHYFNRTSTNYYLSTT